MAVVFVDKSGTTYTGLGTPHWHASVPAGTQLGDLLAHAMVTARGTALVSADMPGWTQLGLFDGSFLIAVKYAEAADVGGWAGEVCTGLITGGGDGDLFPASITGCYRTAFDYGGVVDSGVSAAGTTHTVPAVLLPQGASTVIAFGRTMPPGSGNDVAATSSIPGFTFRGHYQGFNTLVGQIWTNGIELHDLRPVGPGTVGPWTSTETESDKKEWAVLGLDPRTPSTGLHVNWCI